MDMVWAATKPAKASGKKKIDRDLCMGVSFVIEHRDDLVADLAGEADAVAQGEARGGNWFSNAHPHGAGTNNGGSKGKHGACSVQGDGHQRDAGLDGDISAAFFEWLEVSGLRAAAFGED